MEIGGYDIVIKVIDGKTDSKAIDEQIKKFINWPNAVSEDASINGCHLDDHFWYENQEAMDAWNFGDAPEDCMIHFMFDSFDQMTLVCDKGQHDQIMEFLKDNQAVLVEEYSNDGNYNF